MGVRTGTSQIFSPRLGPAGEPAHTLTAAQYLAAAIAIAVYPIMEAGQINFAAANDQAEAAIDDFKRCLEASAPPGCPDPVAWAAGKVGELFKAVQNFEGDVWYSSMPDLQPLLVVKQAAIDEKGLSLEQAVQRVHLALVTEALQDGLSVPGNVMEEYRLSLESLSTREIQ